MKKILLLILVLSVITTITQAQGYETGSNASTNFPANSFDATNYSKIPVVKKIDDCFGDSYLFYFVIGKTRFRVVHIADTIFPQIAIIQKYHNKKWCDRLSFETLNHFSDFKLKDVNNDGYADLVRNTSFYKEVYFYNPTINNFIDSVCCKINYDIHLIDSARHIYCDFQEGRFHCGQIHSTLYSIVNFRKKVFYDLELFNCDTAREYCDIKTLILSKCINYNEYKTEELETIHLKKPLDEEKDHYFNNKAFWQKRYKKLLGYQ